MATSDTAKTYNCSRCEERKINNNATHYCNNCRKAFCSTCEELHSVFYTNHVVLDKLEEWTEARIDEASRKCQLQNNPEIKYPCQQQDCQICYNCIALHHRSCKLQLHTPETAVSNAPCKLKKNCESTEQVHLERRAETQKYWHSKVTGVEQCQQQMMMWRPKLQTILDKLQENLDHEFKDIVNTLNKNVTAYQAVLEDDKETFCEDIKGKKTERSEKLCQHFFTEKSVFQFHLSFTPDWQIENYLSNLQTLGQIHVQRQLLGNTMAAKDCKHDTTNTSTKDPDEQIYTACGKKTFTLKKKCDQYSASVNGFCVLPGGKFVISDFNNKKLMLLDTTCKTITSLKLQSVPGNITSIENNEIAFLACSETNQYTVQLFEIVNDKFKFNREIPFYCSHFVYNDGLLYSANYIGNKIQVQCFPLENKYPKVLKMIDLLKVYRLAVSKDGRRIYAVCFKEDNLTTFDNHGDLVSRLEDDRLKALKNVCVAGNGTVFVCGEHGTQHSTIFQVDQDGGKILTILDTEIKTVPYPEFLCFDNERSMLCIANHHGNMMQLKLK